MTDCSHHEALRLLERVLVAQTQRTAFAAVRAPHCYDEEDFQRFLREHVPSILERPILLARVKEAAAIAADHQGGAYPVVQRFGGDDAPQFEAIPDNLAFCWGHDGRFSKKLRPVVPYYAQPQDELLTSYGEYYHKLLAYKASPSTEAADALSAEFDHVFSTHPGDEDSDGRIAKTNAKKESLLLVRTYPERPLHNNARE